MTKTVRVGKRGGFTLPKKLRDKYRLEEGDSVVLIDMGEGVMLSPKQTTVPKLAAELEGIMEMEGVSLEQMLEGVAEERSKSLNS